MKQQTHAEFIQQQKDHIANAIQTARKDQNLSLRDISDNIDNFSYPQLHRITSSNNNYNIHTLLKVLNELDLEIAITKKGSKDNV